MATIIKFAVAMATYLKYEVKPTKYCSLKIIFITLTQTGTEKYHTGAR
jgi:hypothetical protein